MRHRLAGLIIGLAACGAGVMPAGAQSAGDILFAADRTVLRPKRPANAPPLSPPPTVATGFNLSSPPPDPGFQPWSRSAPTAAATQAAPKPAAGLATTDAPLPPKPLRIGPQPPSGASASPAQAASEDKLVAMAAAPPVKAEPLTDREIVEKANAFFTNLGTLVADFTQIGADGRRLTGTLYLQRPGRLRFEYDRPATIEVVADGSSVAVRDTKLATQDLYSISQTPLKFLLRERVNLGQDIRITNIANDGDGVRIALEDKSTLGGTSRITLFFDSQVQELAQWRIVDAQGFLTTVILTKVQRGRRLDKSLFVINYDRAIPDNNR